MITVCDQMLYI